MGVRMTNVTHLPPLTRPGQSAPESHCQKITLKIESKWKHIMVKTAKIITPSDFQMKRKLSLENSWISTVTPAFHHSSEMRFWTGNSRL